MNKVIKLRRGLDIRIQGVADGSLRAPAFFHEDYAVKPVDFWDMRPKLLVEAGSVVKAGTPLFYDKNREAVKVTSPVSGTVTEIVYGPKRRIEEIRLKADKEMAYETFTAYSAADLAAWDGSKRETAVRQLLDAGLWAFIRRRPYDTIADPARMPRDIFISCFDTAPLAPDMDMLAHGREEDFQAGVDVLRTLTAGKVHLGLHVQKNNAVAFTECKRAELHYFEGPHPCGNVGIQIHHIAPIDKGEEVWYVHPQDVMVMGRLFLKGRYDATKIVALAGSEIIRTSYHKVLAGVSVRYFLQDNVKGMERGLEVIDGDNRHTVDGHPADIRVISGNVLTGTKISAQGYLGAYDHLISVIPEGNRFRFMGWLTLGLNMFSFSKTFFSWLFPQRTYRIDTNVNGGKRAFVLTGEFEKVLPMDIYPMQLLKACITQDIEAMENLGIYEVSPEDFALCEYIDASKTDIQQIIRDGLELMRKEMSE
ncbi:MAG: Na(+)-translocating NADH-quinone reductase subunit A [Bacteroidales bacterium]|nr:Na(+)-translocating NADH-quinone reductase subunit A [Bacteroidales bacterium]MDE7103467.1 Na(+)-translocating NADH-quinone reductase subunit A [Bacteroidales bacterium]